MPLLNILQNDFFTQMYAVCMSIHINFVDIEVLVARSNLCNPMDCSPPGSSVHGIPQARILEWVATSSFRGSSRSRDWTWVSCTAGWFITIKPHSFKILFSKILNILWLFSFIANVGITNQVKYTSQVFFIHYGLSYYGEKKWHNCRTKLFSFS